MKLAFITPVTFISSFPSHFYHLGKIFSLNALHSLPRPQCKIKSSQNTFMHATKLSPYLLITLHCMKNKISPQPFILSPPPPCKSTSVNLFLILQNKCSEKRNECYFLSYHYLQNLNFNSSNIQYKFTCQFLYSL